MKALWQWARFFPGSVEEIGGEMQKSSGHRGQSDRGPMVDARCWCSATGPAELSVGRWTAVILSAAMQSCRQLCGSTQAVTCNRAIACQG